MKFDTDKYEAAARQYHEKWAAVGDTLYGLCRKYPDHTDRSGVYAKLAIIGRTYATGIERQIRRSTKTQGSAMSQLADLFWGTRKLVDHAMAPLREISEPLTAATVTSILTAHGQLLWIADGVTRDGHKPRSFVSKYLHFHCSAVPIYDRYAADALKTIFPRMRRSTPALTIPAGGDGEYAWFVQRFWLLHQEAQAAGVAVKVKLLDEYLLAIAADKR